MKRALLILGDNWHCAGPLINVFKPLLEKYGFTADTIIDYDVPFESFSDYDLIILSRYGWNDIRQSRYPERYDASEKWLTDQQEWAFEKYAANGGRLLLHHDAVAFYRENGGIHTVSKAWFKGHPDISSTDVKITDVNSPFNEGIMPFTISDEEFVLDIDEAQTHIYLESISTENGRSLQGWAHAYGNGQVAAYVPGHNATVLSHPMVKQGIENIIVWLNEN